MRNSLFLQAAAITLVLMQSACDSGGSSDAVAQPEVQDYAAILLDTSWELVDIVVLGGYVFEPEQPGDYTLRFRSEGRLTGQSDCNTFTANWEAVENLVISNYNSTRSMCVAGSLHNYYSLYLRQVISANLSADNLVLETDTEGVRLEFRPAG